MELLSDFNEQPITKQLILSALKNYKRPYDKINELVKQGDLTPVKRGIYIAGSKAGIKRPEPFLLANHLTGPSYISMESALSYWGLIPEKVFEITSVTTQKSIVYKTKVGRYRYVKVPLPYYAFGLRRVELTPRQHIMIATAEKALCDKITTTSRLFLRSTKQAKDFLIDDLRIDRDDLRKLDIAQMEIWLKHIPKRNSIAMLIKTLKNL